MVGSDRSRSIRRLLASVAALAIATTGLVATPAPAAAVHAAPWRFATVTVNTSISGYNGAEPIKEWVLPCPAGYTAVSGGVASGDDILQLRRLHEYPEFGDGTFHIGLRNVGTNGTALTLRANCVWLDDLGSITTVWAGFGRNGSGLAGGAVRCPAGTTLLSGITYWDTDDIDRVIRFSTPITDNTQYGTGWYAEGYSDVSNSKLYVEVRCVDASLLVNEYATATDSTDPVPGYGDATAVCVSGYRTLTGGVGPAATFVPGTYHGSATSGPSGERSWPARGYESSGTLRALALCVPASTVSLAFTQTPASLSNQSSGTIAFTATDSAGESLTYDCYFDGAPTFCSGSPFPYGPVLDGGHSFSVYAENQSGDLAGIGYGWTVDATVPTITNHTPTASAGLSGPFTITFSEPVTGVTTSSVIVHAESANVNVAGTIARPTTSTATWTPKVRLVPGETYRVSFTTAIHDLAGNSLTATYYTVRAATIVDNTSPVLLRYWDLDQRTIASGGAYVVSHLSGARAELTFTATAGQTVSVYGIRLPDGGYADIYLDGVKKATPSFYAATAARARVYLSAALTAGSHTISIRPLGTKPAGSTNSWVAIDNLLVGATVKQETTLKQVFRRVTTASAYGGSYDTITQGPTGDSTPAKFQLTAVGTGFKVYATKTSSSGQARVYVDGVLKTTINLNSASTVYKALVYSTTFALGQHVIRIEAVGTATGTTSFINVDRITVN